MGHVNQRTTDTPNLRISLLLKSQLRFLAQHRFQTLLAILGITLGITVVVAVDLTNSSANRSFALSYQRVTEGATHRIVGGSKGLDEQLYQRLRMDILPRFAGLQAAPVIESYVHPKGMPHHLLQLLAIDPIAEPSFRRYISPTSNNAVAQTSNPTSNSNNPITQLILQPGAALLSWVSARQLGVQPGDTLSLVDNGQVFQVEVIGLIGDESTTQYTGLLIMDIGSAQRRLRRPATLDRIDLKIPPARATEVKQLLTSVLPTPARLETTATAEQGARDLVDAFQLNLQALGLLTLLVGIFLIHNTTNSFVLQRQLLFSRMRALGVDRQQLATGIIIEALLLGGIGTLLGLPFGIWLCRLLIALNTQTLNDHFYTTSITTLFLSPTVLVKAIALGLLVTLLAAAIPMTQAVRRSASQHLQRISQEQPLLSPMQRTVVVCLLLLSTIALVGIDVSGLLGGFIAIFCLLAAVGLITSPLLKGLLQCLNHLLPRALPISVTMAVRDTNRNLSRTGIACVALLIAVASANGIGVMVESFRETLSHWLQSRVNADAYIRPLKTASIHQRQFVPQSVIEHIRQQPHIKAISLYIDFDSKLNNEQGGIPVEIVGAQLPEPARRGYRFSQALKGKESLSWQAFENGAVLIAEPLANRLGLSVGEPLSLPTDRGNLAFTIAGIYYDYGSVRGRILIDRNHLLNHWDRPGVETLGIYYRPEITPDQRDLTRLLEQSAAQAPLIIAYAGEVLDQGLRVFDRTFSITHGLRLLVLAVAMIGIVSALSSLQLERQRETRHLSALGFTHSQLLLQQLTQALILGTFVGLLAIPLGQLLAWMLVKVINLRAFGWSMALQPQWHLCLSNLLLTIIAALGAALLAHPGVRHRFRGASSR